MHIKSTDSIELDGNYVDDVNNSKSIFYLGWEGALTARKTDIKSNTFLQNLTLFQHLYLVISIFNLQMNKDPDDYSGYARIFTQNNDIIQSQIIIYDVEINNL